MPELISRAVAFAAKQHDGQNRKGSALPYIVHPAEVLSIAATMTDDPELLAAAVLHDVIEDSDATFSDLVQRFGFRVADLVKAESDEKTSDAVRSWQMRKLQTILRLKNASQDEMIIALADKLSNLRAMERDYRVLGNDLWSRFNQPNPSMQGWYYRSVGEALRPLRGFAAYDEFCVLLERVFGAYPAADN